VIDSIDLALGLLASKRGDYPRKRIPEYGLSRGLNVTRSTVPFVYRVRLAYRLHRIPATRQRDRSPTGCPESRAASDKIVYVKSVQSRCWSSLALSLIVTPGSGRLVGLRGWRVIVAESTGGVVPARLPLSPISIRFCF